VELGSGKPLLLPALLGQLLLVASLLVGGVRVRQRQQGHPAPFQFQSHVPRRCFAPCSPRPPAPASTSTDADALEPVLANRAW
jgi:hypothetical protein